MKTTKYFRSILVGSFIANIILVCLVINYHFKINNANEINLSSAINKLADLPYMIENHINSGSGSELIISKEIDNTLESLGRLSLIGQDSGWLSDKDNSTLWELYFYIENDTPRHRELSDGDFTTEDKIRLLEVVNVLKRIDWRNITTIDQFIDAAKQIVGKQ